jgi:hypothetical protein
LQVENLDNEAVSVQPEKEKYQFTTDLLNIDSSAEVEKPTPAGAPSI